MTAISFNDLHYLARAMYEAVSGDEAPASVDHDESFVAFNEDVSRYRVHIVRKGSGKRKEGNET